MKLNWMDAQRHTPPEESLLLVIEDEGGGGASADMVTGFYADGEYHTGTTTAGDPLPEGRRVLFWAIPPWPEGYDANGIRQDYEGYHQFTLANGHDYFARQVVDGILIDPKLPADFENTPNDERRGQEKFWNVPFIVTDDVAALDAFYAGRTDEHAAAGLAHWQSEGGRAAWLKAWPSGMRYETRCLDGGAWDRSTSWGMFPTLAQAIHCAKTGERGYR